MIAPTCVNDLFMDIRRMRNMKTIPIDDGSLTPQESQDIAKVLVNGFIRFVSNILTDFSARRRL